MVVKEGIYQVFKTSKETSWVGEKWSWEPTPLALKHRAPQEEVQRVPEL